MLSMLTTRKLRNTDIALIPQTLVRTHIRQMIPIDSHPLERPEKPLQLILRIALVLRHASHNGILLLEPALDKRFLKTLHSRLIDGPQPARQRS